MARNGNAGVACRCLLPRVERTCRSSGATSVFDRCCRKSRKSNEAKNLANVDFRTIPPLRCSVAPIRRSVVAFLRSEVVPHVAAPETHQQLWKISFVSAKRLFRQYRSNSEVRTHNREVGFALKN